MIFLLVAAKLNYDEIKLYVEEKISNWQPKGEFENTLDYQKRVNQSTRAKMIEKYQNEAINEAKKKYEKIIDLNFKLKEYDADNETFLMYSDQLGELVPDSH